MNKITCYLEGTSGVAVDKFIRGKDQLVGQGPEKTKDSVKWSTCREMILW